MKVFYHRKHGWLSFDNNRPVVLRADDRVEIDACDPGWKDNLGKFSIDKNRFLVGGTEFKTKVIASTAHADQRDRKNERQA